MDTGQRSARITVKTIVVHRFDRRASRVAKVRNVSKVGSQTEFFLSNAATTRVLKSRISCFRK